MNRRQFGLALVGLTLTSGGAIASARGELRKGVSDRAARQLNSAAAQYQELQAREHLQRLAQFGSQVEQTFAAQRVALARAIAASPELSSYQRDLQALMDRTRAAVGRTQDHAVLSRLQNDFAMQTTQLTNRHAAALNQAFSDLKLDPQQVSAATVQLLSRSFGTQYTYSSGPMGTTTAVSRAAPPPPVPPQTAFGFTPGYTHPDTFGLANGVASATPVVEPSAGTTRAHVFSMYAGSSVARASVAEYLTVPAGFTRFRVTARFHSLRRYDGLSIGGVSAAGGGLFMELHGTGGAPQKVEYHLGTIVVPILWHVEEEASGPYVHSHTFLISSAGGEYLIKVGGYSDCWSAGNAGASARTSTEPVESIAIELLP